MVCHKKILVVLFVLLEASLAPCAAVAFENGRIVVKGKLVFDARRGGIRDDRTRCDVWSRGGTWTPP